MPGPVATTPHRIAATVTALIALVGSAGCAGSPQSELNTATASTTDDEPVTLVSPAFTDGARLPERFTCQGEGVSPPLTWTAPSGAAELALVVDDVDAPGGVFVHWIVTGMASGLGSIQAGSVPAGGRPVANTAGNTGYYPPCPPKGSGVHHYRFSLYRLPGDMQLPAGTTGVQADEAIARASVGQARVTATFER